MLWGEAGVRMKKILVLLAALILLPLPTAKAASEPGVSAQSAILISGDDGTVIFEKNAHERLAMASTTKIMTALLTLEEAERSGDPVIDVTEEMVRVEGSSMGLQAGNRLTLTNLTSGMLLASGNDAANAAALYLGGSQEGFAELMNTRAREIGMTETNFVTPSGLDDEEHYSTAYDMALLGREAMGNEEFARIAGSSTLQVEFMEPEQKVSYTNHNKLLRIYDGCIGIKTGFTKKAGRTLVSAARRDGTTLIAVTLNAPDDWDDHMAMFDYGFETVKTVQMGGEALPETLPVAGSDKQGIGLRMGQKLNMTLPIEQAQEVESRVLLPKFLYAPVRAGEKVGRVQYLMGGEEIYSVPIIAAEEAGALVMPERGFWEKVTDFFDEIFN
ncbi:D-alanyl-D-alanine carboxypeptidase [Acutalibacter muris]|uniref:serine-type D-Ala-D-Ala carboxypeptidase n=2 Tax=Acutalibacter muris TaxID=1796620 RepID=A0A1Z2XNG5_9FIRM|nr:D-alanyl-D-alanine carboxypeptidase [Hungateiclostridiaceae bacterium KB18]ASB39967.1 D-alanyl-D-alanine carboxypeptidase [Acutalibacter muris]MCI9542635.1 D-alanyl-D-alanine carboxypeptidase [Acutalibacter muris]QQR29255.1 D-alanyl-D-alanine carboxypeptidase [Acutalibacter muris]